MTLTPPTQTCACNTCDEARRIIAENSALKKDIAHLKDRLADNDRQRLFKAKADRNNAFIFTLGMTAFCCYGSTYWFHEKYVLYSWTMIIAGCLLVLSLIDDRYADFGVERMFL